MLGDLGRNITRYRSVIPGYNNLVGRSSNRGIGHHHLLSQLGLQRNNGLLQCRYLL